MPNNAQGDEKRKTWRLLAVAVIFALLAGAGTMVYLKYLEHRLEKRLAPAEKQMTSVVVASKDLPIGSKVDTTTMAIRKVPAEYVNSDVITPDQFNSIDGAVLNKALAHGKMLSRDFIDLNIPKDFSGTIQIGHRAVTIQVGEINSVAGLIRPGNYIDLYSRLQGGAASALDSSNAGEVVIPVLEDVLVLATDQRSARPNEDEFEHLETVNRRQTYDTLTLEVTPQEAALITLAESRGSLVATLRNTDDTGGVRFKKVSLEDLVAHSGELLREALNKQQNRSLAGVHVDDQGRLVTQSGVVITDPHVHMNKAGLVVNDDGTVLSGRNLVVGQDGKIRTVDGELVDTESLVAGKGGTLVDKNGTVVDSNGYTPVKGGFMVDKDGRVITHDGTVLSGVTVGKDGRVRTADGRILTADALAVDKDGKVFINPDPGSPVKFDKEGRLVGADGKPVDAEALAGVTGHRDSDFAASLHRKTPAQVGGYGPYEVEYIIGGASDGAATTFTIQVERPPVGKQTLNKAGQSDTMPKTEPTNASYEKDDSDTVVK